MGHYSQTHCTRINPRVRPLSASFWFTVNETGVQHKGQKEKPKHYVSVCNALGFPVQPRPSALFDALTASVTSRDLKPK